MASLPAFSTPSSLDVIASTSLSTRLDRALRRYASLGQSGALLLCDAEREQGMIAFERGKIVDLRFDAELGIDAIPALALASDTLELEWCSSADLANPIIPTLNLSVEDVSDLLHASSAARKISASQELVTRAIMAHSELEESSVDEDWAERTRVIGVNDDGFVEQSRLLRLERLRHHLSSTSWESEPESDEESEAFGDVTRNVSFPLIGGDARAHEATLRNVKSLKGMRSYELFDLGGHTCGRSEKGCSLVGRQVILSFIDTLKTQLAFDETLCFKLSIGDEHHLLVPINKGTLLLHVSFERETSTLSMAHFALSRAIESSSVPAIPDWNAAAPRKTPPLPRPEPGRAPTPCSSFAEGKAAIFRK